MFGPSQKQPRTVVVVGKAISDCQDQYHKVCFRRRGNGQIGYNLGNTHSRFSLALDIGLSWPYQCRMPIWSTGTASRDETSMHAAIEVIDGLVLAYTLDEPSYRPTPCHRLECQVNLRLSSSLAFLFNPYSSGNMSTSRVQETRKYKPLTLPPALPSTASCTLPPSFGSNPSTFIFTSTSTSAFTSTQHLAPRQHASVCVPTTPKTSNISLSFDPPTVLTPPAPLRVRNRYADRSRTIDHQITIHAQTAIQTRSGLSSNFVNSIPPQPLPLSAPSSPLRYPSVPREDVWNNDEYWKPVTLTHPPPHHRARSSDSDFASESNAQVSHFPKYSGVYHGPYEHERVPISSVTMGSPSLRFPYSHSHKNPNKSTADIYLVSERVDYRAHDKINDSELSEDEDSGWLFFGQWACAIPAITNLFASMPESTPNMLLLRNRFYEHHLPRAPWFGLACGYGVGTSMAGAEWIGKSFHSILGFLPVSSPLRSFFGCFPGFWLVDIQT